jgi:hypothetical protein
VPEPMQVDISERPPSSQQDTHAYVASTMTFQATEVDAKDALAAYREAFMEYTCETEVSALREMASKAPTRRGGSSGSESTGRVPEDYVNGGATYFVSVLECAFYLWVIASVNPLTYSSQQRF